MDLRRRRRSNAAHRVMALLLGVGHECVCSCATRSARQGRSSIGIQLLRRLRRLHQHQFNEVWGNPRDIAFFAAFPAAKISGNIVSNVETTELADDDSGLATFSLSLGGQSLQVVPDTGSFGLLVASKRCHNCPFRSAYDPASSQSYRSLGDGRAAILGSGNIWLEKAEDELVLPGLGPPRRQVFWEIIRVDDQFARMWRAPFVGILGLPWRTVVPHFLGGQARTVTEEFGVSSFVVCLSQNSPAWRNHEPSRLYWGSPGALQDALRWRYESVAARELASLGVIGENHWALMLNGVTTATLGATRNIACFNTRSCSAVIDTGSTVIAVPPDQLVGLLGGPVAQDCSNLHALPDIRLVLTGSTSTDSFIAVLKPQAYVQRIAGNGHVQDVCRSLIVAHSVHDSAGAPVWILGTPFLKQFVVEFDRSQKPARISISDHPGACPPASNSGFGERFSDNVLEPSPSRNQQLSPHNAALRASLRSDIGPPANVQRRRIPSASTRFLHHKSVGPSTAEDVLKAAHDAVFPDALSLVGILGTVIGNNTLRL